MELLTDGTGNDSILGFCKTVISRHVDNWPPKEEALAEEFVDWFGLNSFLTRDMLKELCRAKGVNLAFIPLPQEIRGFNCSFQEQREIVIAERDITPFSDLHTLLHEFREMLEHVFSEIGHPTIGPENSLELQAEDFAIACRVKTGERELPGFLEMLMQIEKKWARYLAYAFFAIFGVVYFFSCVLTPQMEDALLEARRQRYERT